MEYLLALQMWNISHTGVVYLLAIQVWNIISHTGRGYLLVIQVWDIISYTGVGYSFSCIAVGDLLAITDSN